MKTITPGPRDRKETESFDVNLWMAALSSTQYVNEQKLRPIIVNNR